MSTQITTQPPTTEIHTKPAGSVLFAAVSKAASVALIVNLLIFVFAKLGGIEFTLTPPGGPAMEVQALSIVSTTLIASLIGGLFLLMLATFTRFPARQLTAWAGLSVGVLTMAMPLLMEGDTTARFMLAAMHLITGFAWFALVRPPSTK